ncbi:MAG: T9SS type A sorting domain-containing protein, partial [Candidatus Delongbacteria bacterium]|nr:T9SS type A sorting domain-containing protein [Candidatus Delongbacteria bacterium]
NPTTEINFTLNHNSLAKLTVFNSSGEVVKTLNNSKLSKGHHSFSFEGNDLNSGLYFYQLEVDGVRSTKKMILMK